VVKRGAKTHNEKADYAQSQVSQDAAIKVQNVLTHLTDSLKVEYAAQLAEQFIALVKGYVAADPSIRRKMRRADPTLGRLIGLKGVMDLKTIGTDDTLLSGFEKPLRLEAERLADEMQRAFLSKNVAKLAKIVELKGNLAGEPIILGRRSGAGVFEGDIRFHFEDGSAFTVRNQVVCKRNRYGTRFNQFPTTFHNVELPGGNSLSRPSERRMIEMFAVRNEDKNKS
jgi:hypothetical protein